MSTVRFKVSKTENDPIGESSTDSPKKTSYGTDDGHVNIPKVQIVDSEGGIYSFLIIF